MSVSARFQRLAAPHNERTVTAPSGIRYILRRYQIVRDLDGAATFIRSAIQLGWKLKGAATDDAADLAQHTADQRAALCASVVGFLDGEERQPVSVVQKPASEVIDGEISIFDIPADDVAELVKSIYIDAGLLTASVPLPA